MITFIITIACLIFAIICFILGFACGLQHMKDECIERNIAHYDPTTAAFTWDVENPNHRPN